MKLTVLFLATTLMMSCSGSANNQEPKKEYGYIFQETTGQNQYIVVDSQRLPIRFADTSNKMALQSLRALKPSVLYGNCDGKNMFVVGEYDSASHSFSLDHWYLKVPFVEFAVEDETQVPHKVNKVNRTSLERSDFERKGGFDPLNPSFDPHLFEKRSSSPNN
jgi:hypothetical protein